MTPTLAPILAMARYAISRVKTAQGGSDATTMATDRPAFQDRRGVVGSVRAALVRAAGTLTGTIPSERR